MNSPAITHIVPALARQIDVVGDYALDLAGHLRERHGLKSQFIVCNPNWQGPSRVEEFAVRRLRMRDEAGIWMLLSSSKGPTMPLLHYVGYGYQKRGVPIWLWRGIRSWLREQGG